MGGNSSQVKLKDIATAKKTYTSSSVGKQSQIENRLGQLIIEGARLVLWKIIPIAGTVADITDYATNFFNYTELFTSTIDLLNEDDSINPLIKLMKEKIQKESARSAFASIRAKISTIESRVKESYDSSLSSEMRRTQAAIAANTCEEILNLFDNDDYILWDMAVTSSSILLPFSAICTHVIRFIDQNQCTSMHQSKKMKGQLLSILEDYKKQCILSRLNFVDIETGDHCRHAESGISVHNYGLGNSKFENDRDLDLDHEWYRTYCCEDTWDGWKAYHPTYATIISYRKDLIKLYSEDFDQMIQRTSQALVNITTTSEYTKKDKKFNQGKVTWTVVPVY